MSRRPPHPPRLSPKESLILDLLIEHSSMYGLELVSSSRGRLKRGTVYVTLGRMEEKGLVESHQEPVSRRADAPTRRMYRATAHGHRVLDAWTTIARTFSMEPAR